MSDLFSKRQRSEVMAAIRSSGNKTTEIKLIDFFRRNRIRGWRRHRPLLGKPDFVFHQKRIVVFVDGCFWHGCPKHFRRPKENASYWRRKIDRNRKRDRHVNSKLRQAGWRVVRFWEHDLAKDEVIVERFHKARLCAIAKPRIQG